MQMTQAQRERQFADDVVTQALALLHGASSREEIERRIAERRAARDNQACARVLGVAVGGNNDWVI